jgi:hypothetical protein
MGIGALVAAWKAIKPFDSATNSMVGQSMQGLSESVANDESLVPAEFEAALAQLKDGLN